MCGAKQPLKAMMIGADDAVRTVEVWFSDEKPHKAPSTLDLGLDIHAPRQSVAVSKTQAVDVKWGQPRRPAETAPSLGCL